MTLLERMRARLDELQAQRAERQSELDAINDAVEERGDSTLTEEESGRLAAIMDELRNLREEEIPAAEARVAELQSEEEARQRQEEARQRYERDPNERRNPRIQVNEPLTYRAGGQHSFFADAFRAARNSDFSAQDRLRQHSREMEVLGTELRNAEQRDVGTGAFGSLVVPQFLVDEFAEVLRNGRAFANAVRSEPLLAEGMVFTIPRGDSGTTAESQSSQNTGVSETDADFDDDLEINVRTIAGQQDVSRQSLERGTPGLDRLIYADLVADYSQELDRQIIAEDGTGGTHVGVLEATGTNAVTYTSTDPGVVEAWPKLADAKRRVGANRKIAGNLWVMTSTRWAWFNAALDGDDRPLIVDNPSAAVNAMGTATAENFGEGQLAGTLMGRPVLLDDNIPSNLGTGTDEDAILFLRRQDPILWEEGDGMPRELRFEETLGGSLTVKLVVYGYSAFTAERYPVGVSIVSGTGLVAPSF